MRKMGVGFFPVQKFMRAPIIPWQLILCNRHDSIIVREQRSSYILSVKCAVLCSRSYNVVVRYELCILRFKLCNTETLFMPVVEH